MTVAPVPPPGAPPALVAFLRGIGRRALLFAALQAGDGPAADAALRRALAGFAAGAADVPMGHWPTRFWKALLAELPKGAAGASPAPERSPGWLPPPGSGARVAVLLALVAGLDEEDGAEALGVDPATWRLALRRAAPRDAGGGFDESAWRALANTLREAQRALPESRLAWWERAGDAALVARATPPSSDVDADGDDAPRRRRVARGLWAAVAACALALGATFVPWGALLQERDRDDPRSAPVEGTPLADAQAPARTYDAEFALRHHPELARLLAGEDDLLRDLDFGAWYAARGAAAGTPAEPAGAQPGAAGTQSGAAPPAPAHLQPQPLPAFDAQSPAQRAELQRRAAAADALPRDERGALRERWDAWLALDARERHAVRQALASLAALPEAERQSLRDAFAAQSLDLQRGWLLGPALGARWQQLQPLLQQVPVAERAPLLARLHAMDGDALDALALLAQRTPPQARDALRRRLIGAGAGAGLAADTGTGTTAQAR